MRAALPENCEYPDVRESVMMPVWRDDGSQVTSVAECWQQCTYSLGDSLVGVDFWPAGSWSGRSTLDSHNCWCHDVCDDMEDWNLD